ncbi:MAG TPA: cupin domain-containing protein [Syntrophorhabdales bacterium]|nr:cupin domain-containing protein [Syntrophorhabdales bacterium]
MIRNRFCFVTFALIVLAIVLVCFVLVDANAQVQIPGVKMKSILQAPLSGDDAKEMLISSGEFAPGVTLPRHTHPGDDYTVVLQGDLELIVEGREPRRVSAGEAFHVPYGQVHYTRVLGDTPVRIIAIWVIEKGKPAMQPVTK